MDKYTVDLDQLLNDFEYSELTDQHSKTVSERPQSSIPFQAPTVTKHSINNVFHSLNEYVNTGINTRSVITSLNVNYSRETADNFSRNDNNSDNIQSTLEKLQIDTAENNEHSEFGGIQNKGEKENVSKLESNNVQETNNYTLTDTNTGPTWIDSPTHHKAESQVSHNLIENLEVDSIKSEEQLIGFHVPQTSPEHVSTISDSSGNINAESIKTESPDLFLIETIKIESELLPELSCTGTFIENEPSNVNKDIECDRKDFDKADSVLSEGLSSFGEKYNVGFEDVREKNDIGMRHDNLGKDQKSTLINVEDHRTRTEEKMEGFVIEPSESPYAFATTGIKEKSAVEEICEQPSTGIVEKEEPTKCDDIPVANRAGEDINKCLSERCESSTSGNNSDSENLKPSCIETLASNQASDLLEDPSLLVTAPATNNPSEEVIRPVKIVGFSADIDIDDNELNKMLEDLELEEVSESVHGTTVEGLLKEHEGTDTSNMANSTEENIVEDLGKDRITAESTGQMENDGNEPQDVSSATIHEINDQTTLNNPSVDTTKKATELGDEYSHPQIIECLEMEEPRQKLSKNKKSIKSTAHNEKSIEDSLANNVSVCQKVDNQSELTENESSDGYQTPECGQIQESVSRPQNLPLNNELKDESIGRKINLIGSPGSTPYNNVYVNKSIGSKTAQDAEFECTSSASPTFSDCSTESTSTASTVSVEDITNNAGKFTRKTLGVKNTNVENESREVAQITNAENAGKQENIIGHSSKNMNEASSDPNATYANVPENVPNKSDLGDGDSRVQSSQSTDAFSDKSWLGREAPLWIPDADASACLHCDMKFTVLKRRHHCRACGLVLCSKCCNLKFKLEYLDSEARVCNKCYDILNKDTPNNAGSDLNSPETGDCPAFRPNPNNPLEYCSTVSPLQQAGHTGAQPPSVMVPVGVLKRKGSNKKSNKSVMFCDGIAPGSDLTNLDQDFNYNSDTKTSKSVSKAPEEVKKKEESVSPQSVVPAAKVNRNQTKIDPETDCFIPKSETNLPPTISVNKTDILYSDCSNSPSVVEMLKNEALVFAINQNLFVQVKIINMNCCINKHAWCFCSEGLINVGLDEVVYLIEYIEEESFVPKDVFFHLHNVYTDAVKGTSIKELGLSLHNTNNFLDSRNHAGFVYIKPTFQCLENVILPKEPYLIGILIHRWETPWAKLFPLRLILRLGAEYRYYPSPLISTRHRESVFVEIGHTIINLLADFRNFTYTLPQIRGLIIHMEDKKTTVIIPKNRYDQVMKSINSFSEHILAFAGNFSPNADSHLVCIQDTQGHENCYTTHAINIHNQPRKVTGASFIVFNGSLKSTSGLTAKSNIVEDGLMIQVSSEDMEKIRENLRNMKNHTISCGCVNAFSDETVNIVWGENDVEFNVGVKSPVDLTDMKGIPSIRVHNGKDYFCNVGTRLIRWTEVFILQNGEENPKNQDPVDISKVSESIAKACCTALVKYLDLLVSNSCQKIGIRATLHVENVSYSAGSNGLKLPPIYMRSLDNELVPVLHRITSNNLGDNAIVLELIFRILNA